MAFMQVSRKVDYALRAVIHLADDEHRGRACSVAEIADRERIPRQFLEKIIRDLIGRVWTARSAVRTGYVQPPPTRSPSGVIEASRAHLPQRLRRGACGVLHARRGRNRVWAEGQRRVMDLFQNTTIARSDTRKRDRWGLGA
jgi:DNA-binding IscR family transcriptional regulator